MEMNVGNYANHSLMVLIKVSWSCTLTDACGAVSDASVCVCVCVRLRVERDHEPSNTVVSTG